MVPMMMLPSPRGNMSHGHQPKSTDPDKAHSSIPGLALYDCAGHLNLHGPVVSRPLAPIWPQEASQYPSICIASMISGDTDIINTDLGCGRAMNADMTIGSSPGPDDTIAPVAS